MLITIQRQFGASCKQHHSVDKCGEYIFYKQFLPPVEYTDKLMSSAEWPEWALVVSCQYIYAYSFILSRGEPSVAGATNVSCRSGASLRRHRSSPSASAEISYVRVHPSDRCPTLGHPVFRRLLPRLPAVEGQEQPQQPDGAVLAAVDPAGQHKFSGQKGATPASAANFYFDERKEKPAPMPFSIGRPALASQWGGFLKIVSVGIPTYAGVKTGF